MATQRQGQVSAVERATSALAGYVAGSIVVVPFDRVKTLMQATPGERPRAVDVARGVLAREGMRGIYRGLDAQLLIAPYTVLYYSTYDELRQFQGGGRYAPLSAAIGARTLEVTLRQPLELLRTQLQATKGSLTIGAILEEQRHRPLQDWMRGYFPTLLRDVPFSAAYWFLYEEAKRQIIVPETLASNCGLRTLLHSFVCGGLAGMLSALVTTPVDVAKTLRQKWRGTGSSAETSMVGIVRFLIANPSAGLSGIGPRLLRIPLGLATMMSGIETTRWFFDCRRQPG